MAGIDYNEMDIEEFAKFLADEDLSLDELEGLLEALEDAEKIKLVIVLLSKAKITLGAKAEALAEAVFNLEQEAQKSIAGMKRAQAMLDAALARLPDHTVRLPGYWAP